MPTTKPPSCAGRIQPTCDGAAQLFSAPVSGSKRWSCFSLISTNQSAFSRPTQTGPSPSVAPTLQTRRDDPATMSAPAGVDEIIMAGAHPLIVRGEEQHQRRDIGGLDAAVEAL